MKKNKKTIFSFNAVTAEECVKRFKAVFKEYCTENDIISIHYRHSKHISAVDYPLNYPVVIETDKYYFCLHSFEQFSSEIVLSAFI